MRCQMALLVSLGTLLSTLSLSAATLPNGPLSDGPWIKKLVGNRQAHTEWRSCLIRPEGVESEAYTVSSTGAASSWRFTPFEPPIDKSELRALVQRAAAEPLERRNGALKTGPPVLITAGDGDRIRALTLSRDAIGRHGVYAASLIDLADRRCGDMTLGNRSNDE